jgi:hypothetical protein
MDFTSFTTSGTITLGTPSSITSSSTNSLSSTSHTHSLSTVATSKGGTNITTYAQGDILYASATNVLSKLSKSVTATRYLSNQGTNNSPSWNQINLTNGVTGYLPIGNIVSAASSPSTQYLRGDGTWNTPSTAAITEDIAFEFADVTGVAGQTYVLDLSASYGYTITAFVRQSEVATIPFILKKDSTTILDNTATTTTSTTSLSSIVTAGQKITLVLDQTVSGTGLIIRGKIRYTRT